GQEKSAHRERYRDGFITKTNPFQKFFAPGELEDLIEQTLDAEVMTLGMGICAVFRDQNEAELFEASRNRRRIDWTEISSQLRFSSAPYRHRTYADRYDLHKDLFDQFWKTMLDLGRVPEPGEFDRLIEVRRAAGGVKRAVQLVISQNGDQLWNLSKSARSEDTLVYLAMMNFRKRLLRREIPLRVRNDIRIFFGDLHTALGK